MNSRNHKKNAHGGIDCEIEHATLGWIPFSAIPGDAASAEILAAADSGDYGALADYVKPQAEIDAETNAAALRALAMLDLQSIRAMREYIAGKADAPQILKDREAAAQSERAKLKP